MVSLKDHGTLHPILEDVPLHEFKSFTVLGVTLLSKKMSTCGKISLV